MKKIALLFAFTAFCCSINQRLWAEDTGWRRATTYNNNGVTSPHYAYSPYMEDHQTASFNSWDNSSIDYGGFGISIPEGKRITGIEVQLVGSANPNNLTVNLSWNNGSDFTNTSNHSHFSTNYTLSTEYFGGPVDLWETSGWTASELSNGNFLVRLAFVEGFQPGSTDLDFIAVKVYYQSTTSPITFLSNGTFVVPEGVTEVTVQAWGAGGKGGRTFGEVKACGGGGGGAYSSSILTVTPGAPYTVHVGIGTEYVTLYGDADSWFGSTSTLFAKGGQSGSSHLAGAGGSTDEGIGDVKYNGGNGASGDNDYVYDENEQLIDIIALTSGGGGSSAGNEAAGSNASSYNGAIAPEGGGNGANGIQSPETARISSHGNPGFFPGGGGSGAISNGGSYIGGDGGGGQVIVSWEVNCSDGFILLTSDTREQTVDVNNAISDIVYTIGGGATGAEADGLPAGVTGSYENGTFTISGTPTAFGRFYFEVTTTGSEPCQEATDWGIIIVTPPADYCHGSAYAVTTEANIEGVPVGAEFAVGPPDDAIAFLDITDERIELDLTGGGTMRPSGTTITLRAGASCNGSEEPAMIRIHRSDNGTGFRETGTVTLSDCLSLSDYKIVLNGNTRYIAITKINGSSKPAVIDAVTFECSPSCAPTISLGSIGDVCPGFAVYVPYFDASNISCGSESPTEFSIDWESDDVLDWSGNFLKNGYCDGSTGSLYLEMVPKEVGGIIPAETYTGSLSLKNDACTSLEYIISVNVLSIPAAPTIEVTNGSTQICGEGFVTLKAFGPAGAIYSWYKNNELVFNGQSHTFDFFAPDNVPGTYTYQVTQQVPGECESARATVSITVKAVPATMVTPAISEITDVATHVTLTASGADSYSWSSVPAGFTATGSSVTVSPINIKNTTYIVTGTRNGCSSSDEAIIYVKESCKSSPDQYEPNNSMSGKLFKIPIDLTIGANLLNAKDPDWYRLDISSLAKYTLKLTKSGTLNPSLDLYGSTGRRLKSIGRTQPNSYNLATGIYYIKVSAGVKTYLCYTLQVVNDGPVVGAIASIDNIKSYEIEQSTDEVIKIWPNPAHDEFSLYNGNNSIVRIRITDALGRTMENIENVGITQTVVFGRKYKPGIYFVETFENGIQQVFKLIKQ